MKIVIVKNKIEIKKLKNIAENQFGSLVKAVVDVEKEIMAIGGELHSDEEVLLSEHGSKRENTWGINIYPEKSENDWIEFDSMINIKPQYKNNSRGVKNIDVQNKIIAIVNKLISR